MNRNQSLALARQARFKTGKAPQAAKTPLSPNPNDVEDQDADDESSGDEIECTGWSGGVAHYISSDEESILVSDDEEEEEEVEELSGSELEEVIQRHRESTTGRPAVRREEPSAMVKQPIAEPDALSAITGQRSNREWEEAESTRSLGYNGQSTQTKRHRAKAARDKEAGDAKLRKG